MKPRQLFFSYRFSLHYLHAVRNTKRFKLEPLKMERISHCAGLRVVAVSTPRLQRLIAWQKLAQLISPFYRALPSLTERHGRFYWLKLRKHPTAECFDNSFLIPVSSLSIRSFLYLSFI